jgi:hypothetical protein
MKKAVLALIIVLAVLIVGASFGFSFRDGGEDYQPRPGKIDLYDLPGQGYIFPSVAYAAEDTPEEPEAAFQTHLRYFCPNQTAEFWVTGIVPPVYLSAVLSGSGAPPITAGWVIGNAVAHPTFKYDLGVNNSHHFIDFGVNDIDKYSDWILVFTQAETVAGVPFGTYTEVHFLCSQWDLYLPFLTLEWWLDLFE